MGRILQVVLLNTSLHLIEVVVRRIQRPLQPLFHWLSAKRSIFRSRQPTFVQRPTPPLRCWDPRETWYGKPRMGVRGICYELGDGWTTKNIELSVLPCVLFVHSHLEPGLTYLHSIELGPTLHKVSLGGWRPTRGQGTRVVGDSILVSAEEARVLHWFQLYLRLEDIDRCGAVVRDTATHCSSESCLRVVHRQLFGRIICIDQRCFRLTVRHSQSDTLHLSPGTSKRTL